MCGLPKEYCSEGLIKCKKQQDWKVDLARVCKDVEIELSMVEQKGRTQKVTGDLAVSQEYEERADRSEDLDKTKKLREITVEGMATMR